MKLSLLVKSKKIEGVEAGDIIEVEGEGADKNQIPAKYINLVEIVPAKLSEKKLEGSTPSKKQQRQ